ncbi:MAG: hypothetical protein ABSA63_03795 [Thermoplasmata archaeon]|jgi:hypothetical protein
MKVQFSGSVDADGAADEFILAYLARHKGNSVTAAQVWKSLRSRGLTPADGRPTAQNDPDDGVAIAEIGRRLEKWLNEGLVGGEAEPESITGVRHFWVIGNPLTKG